MTTRLGPEQQSRDWPYATTLDGFLADIKADMADRHDTEMRISMFMMTPVARRMPADLRAALIEAGWWAEPVRTRRFH